jgi:endonuclease/exonuclease/phosphatase family metal-dependent hydrolase
LTAIRSLDADIVALQEVDDRYRGFGDPRVFAALPGDFDRHSAAAQTIRSPDGDFGHMLMSRWPIRKYRLLDLSVAGREPRMAISAVIDSPAGPVRILAAHLGLFRRERRRQIDIITRHLSGKTPAAAIVMGDFNEWRKAGVMTHALCPPFTVATNMPSFPSRRPILPLDRIWCRPPLNPLSARAAHEHSALSDHLPIVAELEYSDEAD